MTSILPIMPTPAAPPTGRLPSTLNTPISVLYWLNGRTAPCRPSWFTTRPRNLGLCPGNGVEGAGVYCLLTSKMRWTSDG